MERDRDEWRRPWEADAPAGRVVTAVEEPGQDVADRPHGTVGAPSQPWDGEPTLVRPRPLPPPATWDASQAGPGSPYGSVRPPDTVGTVEAPAPRRSRRGGFVIGMVGALIGAVIGTGTTLAVVGTDEPTTTVTAGPTVSAPSIEVTGDAGNVVPAVARAVTPSVVRIDIIGAGQEQLGLGSGVIYRSDGYIITNNHVASASGSSQLKVKLASGEEFEADVVGTDPLNDLAVLKIAATGLPAINLRSEEPVVGETAIAIGSPFGLDASVTAGVVSAVGRDITVPDDNGGAQVIPAVIQTDAAINPGNSGGALVDEQGRLMGINTAILTGTGGSQGVGFAIPVAQAVATADELIANGTVHHAFLGVSGADVTPEVAQRFGLDEAKGAILETVEAGSGAADAGLQPDDIIVAVEGETIDSMSDLVVAIRAFKPGDTITITYLRDGQRRETDVSLGERPDAS